MAKRQVCASDGISQQPLRRPLEANANRQRWHLSPTVSSQRQLHINRELHTLLPHSDSTGEEEEEEEEEGEEEEDKKNGGWRSHPVELRQTHTLVL